MRSVALGILSLVLTLAPASRPAAQRQRSSPCADAQHHQFDFWIGDWDVFTAGGALAGHNHVVSISNGCGIEEQWSGAGGGHGRSLNTFDATDKRWHQFWVGGDGTVLQLAGSFDGDAMTLASADNRIRFTRNADGTVRQLWEASRDGGKTWQTTFDGKYVRSGRGNAPAAGEP